MHEIRLDVFDSIPEGVGAESLVTLCGKDPSLIPDSFEGLVDVGDSSVEIPHRKIRSIHDFDRTPSEKAIVGMLSPGDQEISKGAFMASTFLDLDSILQASRSLDRKHVLLGMGQIGEVTRIRQKLLRNDFTFGYEGVPTAPGQLSAEELETLGDDCMLVGITGHPLSHTKSPAMQNAAIKAAGINGRYLVFDSPELDKVEDVIRGYEIRGMNVTIPYKERIMEHLDSVSSSAETIGAVNTIVNNNGTLIGNNTDITGIKMALEGTPTEGAKALIMGSGGAARAAAEAVRTLGCVGSLCGRNSETVDGICRDFGLERFEGDIRDMDIIINCTPIGLVEGKYPADITGLRAEQTVFDMVYGKRTPLLDFAESKGCRTMDGTDMLIGQGAASFRMWFGTAPDLDVMRGVLR
jgi:3-dehydroquinate dehydratase/shikimate dehydrogenase